MWFDPSLYTNGFDASFVTWRLLTVSKLVTRRPLGFSSNFKEAKSVTLRSTWDTGSPAHTSQSLNRTKNRPESLTCALPDCVRERFCSCAVHNMHISWFFSTIKCKFCVCNLLMLTNNGLKLIWSFGIRWRDLFSIDTLACIWFSYFSFGR